MMFMIKFDNLEDSHALRDAHLEAHIGYLDRYRNAIVVAGATRDADDSITGGMWLIEAADESAVREIFEEDPFWKAGLRRSVEVARWSRLFPAEAVTL